MGCSNINWATAGRPNAFFKQFFPHIAVAGLAAHQVGRPIWHLPELPDCQSKCGPSFQASKYKIWIKRFNVYTKEILVKIKNHWINIIIYCWKNMVLSVIFNVFTHHLRTTLSKLVSPLALCNIVSLFLATCLCAHLKMASLKNPSVDSNFEAILDVLCDIFVTL